MRQRLTVAQVCRNDLQHGDRKSKLLIVIRSQKTKKFALCALKAARQASPHRRQRLLDRVKIVCSFNDKSRYLSVYRADNRVRPVLSFSFLKAVLLFPAASRVSTPVRKCLYKVCSCPESLYTIRNHTNFRLYNKYSQVQIYSEPGSISVSSGDSSRKHSWNRLLRVRESRRTAQPMTVSQ